GVRSLEGDSRGDQGGDARPGQRCAAPGYASVLQLTSSCGGTAREVVGTSRAGRRTATRAADEKSRARAGCTPPTIPSPRGSTQGRLQDARTTTTARPLCPDSSWTRRTVRTANITSE